MNINSNSPNQPIPYSPMGSPFVEAVAKEGKEQSTGEKRKFEEISDKEDAHIQECFDKAQEALQHELKRIRQGQNQDRAKPA
jgi:hypothetical protein